MSWSKEAIDLAAYLEENYDMETYHDLRYMAAIEMVIEALDEMRELRVRGDEQ